MSLFQVAKPKSAAKIMVPPGKELEDEVLATLEHMAREVGITLGPGGKIVLIERPEMNMKPIITKDGVTVAKALGYDSAIKQLILESARDAALRTASEAGDGTTTATILSSSIANSTAAVVRANSKLSPQKIVRELQALVPGIVEKIQSHKIDVTAKNADSVLLRVATLSANGDEKLAKSVLEAFNTVGSEGNMTIIEAQGDTSYKVERINGYTIDQGYEESCRMFSNGFINDKSGTLVILNNPVFLLYDGIVNDMSQIYEALTKLGEKFKMTGRQDKGVILLAHGFSDMILGDLHVNWTHPNSIVKVFPLMTPTNVAVMNWRTQFLYDLQAYTGSPVFNPIDKPLVDIDVDSLINNNRAKQIEVSRFRTSVIATEDNEAIEIRVNELKLQKEKPESDYELNDLNVRIGKLTSGIARLTVYAPSAGDTREKRDRAEDAWMAIRGATKYGAVPGGGYVLVKLSAHLVTAADQQTSLPKKLAMLILAEAFRRPVEVLYENYGYNAEEVNKQILSFLMHPEETFDIFEQKWIPKFDILDSAPAVIEAIRNSISIASLLGTLGGIVAFKRDSESDKSEEKFVRKFEAATGTRGSVQPDT